MLHNVLKNAKTGDEIINVEYNNSFLYYATTVLVSQVPVASVLSKRWYNKTAIESNRKQVKTKYKQMRLL
jgi:glucose-6-phosphate isomerase